MQKLLKIGSGVPELEDPEKWHFPLKAFIALKTVLRYRADCDAAANIHSSSMVVLFYSLIYFLQGGYSMLFSPLMK